MPNGSKKIIIIDDESEMIQLLRIDLESEGYQVISAGDGKEGLKVIHESKPDLVLLDVMMPKMDGFEVLRALKGDEKTKDIQVILLTAKGMESDIRRGFGLGADDYIIRPFESKFLKERIKAAFKKQ